MKYQKLHSLIALLSMSNSINLLHKGIITLFVILFSISAFAKGYCPGDIQKIWTNSTQQPQPGSIVTFGDTQYKKIYNGYKQAVAYSTDFPTCQGMQFIVIGTDSIVRGSVAFVADSVFNQTTGKYEYLYLNEDLDIVRQDLKPEVCWFVSETGVQNASTITRYIYFDKMNGYFMTTKGPAKVNFFVQDEVAIPKLHAKADEAEYFRIGKDAPQASFQLYTTTDGAKVNYRVGYANTPGADYKWTAWTLAPSEIATINLNATGDYKICAYTSKWLGQTDSVEWVKHVVYLDAPGYSPNSGIAVDIEGDTKVKVWAKTSAAPYSSKYSRAYTRYAIATGNGNYLTFTGQKMKDVPYDSIVNLVEDILVSDQYAGKAVGALYGKTFYIAGEAYATENGRAIECLDPQTSMSGAYVIKPTSEDVTDISSLDNVLYVKEAEGLKGNTGVIYIYEEFCIYYRLSV